MEENENSLKQLKDQLNSLKPEPIKNIDLADYNAYKFARTMMNPPTEIRENNRSTKTLLGAERNQPILRVSSTRDISYRKDIPNLAHYKNCTKGDITERVRNTATPGFISGSGTSYAKHRRAGSTELPSSKQVVVNAQSYPTDIKQLEKLIQYTGPNHRNVTGGRSCQRES